MKNLQLFKIVFSAFILMHLSSFGLMAQRQMENLDRGLVAVKTANGVFLSWRVLGTDPKNISFNIYRNGTKLNATPITGATNMIDAVGSTGANYTVRPIVGGTEQAARGSASVWGSQVQTITLSNRPSSSHSPNDINVGDLDGDGQYELVVKWYPSNAVDNSQSGITNNTYLAAYKMDGTFLWIVDLGRNIRSGAHYTQHLVGDYDSDGFAEVACKTAPGTKDGVGAYLSTGPAAADNDATSYVNGAGYILSGPEYLTIFNGKTGKEMSTINYPVPRGNVGSWGDTYGNRVDRFNSTNAYLDGVHPSMIFQRGYYTRLTAAAMDWNGRTLSTRWIFDSNNAGSTAARGQGNHSVMAADIDGDGFDEILTGSACIDHDGKLKWTTGFGHGDANHVGDFDPNSAGLEVWQVSENKGSEPDQYMIRASDGRVLWRTGSGTDNGRGMIADIDARYPGQEAWSNSVGGTYEANGTRFTTSKPSSANFRVYWDGDLQDELPNGNSTNTNNRIDKWNGNGTSSIFSLTGQTCNGTKGTPNILADLLGDWREEIILHDGANHLYIHTTTIPTQYKMYTLMHDPAYRNAISYQQSSYNQPPHLGFWLGAGIDKVPTPNIVLVGQTPSNQLPTVTLTAPINNANFTAPASVTISANATDADGTINSVDFYNGSSLIGSDATAPFSFNWTNLVAGTYSITAVATDNVGGTTTSTAVTVKVNAVPVLGFTLQGESACSADGVLNENTNTGFRGTGYVNLDNTIGSKAKWAVSAAAQGNVSLTIHYANGTTANRTMSVSVNGIIQVASVSFPGSGAWTTWNNAVVQVTLPQGNNIITLSSLTADGGPNVDELFFGSENVTSGQCDVVTPPVNTAPTVRLTSPVTGADFTAPATISMSATAADSDGSVSKVEFFNGTTLLGSDVSAPYSFSWTAVSAGTYSITAKATDNEGAVTTTAAVSVIVKPLIITPPVNAPPTVRLTSPVTGTDLTAPATISISATAADSDGSINKVEFFNGTTLLGSDVSAPYSFSWTAVAAGTYSITAKATDNEGAVTTTAAVSLIVKPLIITPPVNTAPTVRLTSPVTGADFTAPATISISATAADSDGSVSKVEFFNGTTLLDSDVSAPYSFSWTAVSAGTYSITAKATDNEGAVTTTVAVSVIVKPLIITPPVNTAPTVRLTSPVTGADFTAPATISMSATAADSDGSVSKVEFFNGTTLLGSDVSAPYSFSWTAVAAGTYSITAKATDNEGAVTTTAAVSVTVKPLITSVDSYVMGPDCGSLNTTISFEVDPSKRNGATAYSWWTNGYSKSMTPASGAQYKMNLQTGEYYIGGEVCVGISYNVAPYYATYCKKITACTGNTASLRVAQTVLVGPNPSTNTFQLTALENISSVSVFNSYGQEVFSNGQIFQGDQLNFGNEFNIGMYYLTIIYSSGVKEVIRLQKI